MSVKVIPISKEYRLNYDHIFKKVCKCCFGRGKVVYGSETETGTFERPCPECKGKK